MAEAMTIDEVLLDAEEHMTKTVEHFQGQLVGIRTGRATPGLVDSVRVDYYGTPTPLKQLANISAPEAQLLVVRPFDTNAIKEIEKGIQAANIGLTPNSDGKVVRLAVPSLSGDQRKKLIHRVKELAEEARVSIRSIRRDANKHADVAEKENAMTEDDVKTCKDKVQELTKTYEGKINDMADAKETEVSE